MSDSRVTSFAEQFFNRADSFIKKGPVNEKKIKLGRLAVNITVPAAGPHEEPDILGGFLEAKSSAASPTDDAAICLFDDRFGSALPEGTWPADYHFPLGIIKEELSSPYKIAIDRHTSTVTVFNTLNNRCAVWISSTSKLPYWAAATAFRLQLAWIANTFNAELTHAAAIERQGCALLISGASGVGKSTITLLTAQNGFALIGDDYVLVDGDEVSAVYTRGKLHDKSLALPEMGRLAVLNPKTENEKRIIDLPMSPDIKMAHTAKIKGIALPIQADMSTFQPIPHGRALKLIAPASLGGLLGGTPSSLIRLRQLVASFPTFRWALSNDITEDMLTLNRIWDAAQGHHA
jgi:hypothetical protein